jgi:serine/threonine protein kinase
VLHSVDPQFAQILACKPRHPSRVHTLTRHHSLKLGNLFLNDKMEVRLGDFGLATKLEFEGEKKRTICGTPNYIVLFLTLL